MRTSTNPRTSRVLAASSRELDLVENRVRNGCPAADCAHGEHLASNRQALKEEWVETKTGRHLAGHCYPGQFSQRREWRLGTGRGLERDDRYAASVQIQENPLADYHQPALFPPGGSQCSSYAPSPFWGEQTRSGRCGLAMPLPHVVGLPDRKSVLRNRARF